MIILEFLTVYYEPLIYHTLVDFAITEKYFYFNQWIKYINELQFGYLRLGYKIGIQDWDLRLGYKIGIQDWDTRLGYKQRLDTRLGYKQGLDTRLGYKQGLDTF